MIYQMRMSLNPTLAGVLLLVGAPSAFAATLSEGRAAYSQNRVADAERIYSEVIADRTASTADRSAAERELARIAWLIDGNAKRALSHLDAARQIADRPCETAAMMARVLRESEQAAVAVRMGDALLARCAEPDGRDSVRTHIVGAYLDLAATDQSDRADLIERARGHAATFSPDADVEAARVRLEIGLVSGDAVAALAAWKDYFWLDETDAPQAFAGVNVTKIFNDGLRTGASVDDRLKLADLLMRTGFATQLERFARASNLQKAAANSPVWERFQAFWSAREKFEAELLKQNRRFARAGKVAAFLKAEAPVLKKANMEWTTALMAAAGEKGDPKTVLRNVYGLVGTDLGETDSYPSVHLGHMIENHDDTVTQYGKTAKIHFMAIDNMISNSFISWLADGASAVGGWTADGIIVHIRPGYVQSPLSSYRQTQNSESRRRLIARERQLAAEDLAKLKQRPVATLNGLNDRLQMQIVDRVAAAARTRSTDEASFRRAFLAEYSRANLDQSIRKHEGRHAIDEALGISAKVEQPVLEYQAKLSELALTDYPRMALRNLNSNLEGTGMHDKAGAKIFDDYRKWMEAHTGEIMGYDPSIPVLAQFDKLTDGQIREIARNLDPLPNGKPSPAKL